jgi:hypothetical protein
MPMRYDTPEAPQNAIDKGPERDVSSPEEVVGHQNNFYDPYFDKER